MKRGKLTITSTYCKPDGGGLHHYRARCAVTGEIVTGSGARTTASKELKSFGWRFVKGEGWCSPAGDPR